MKKLFLILAILINGVFALDQETTCLVLKVNEKEFVIVKDCKDVVKAFDDFAKRTGRYEMKYQVSFDGTWYRFKFE